MLCTVGQNFIFCQINLVNIEPYQKLNLDEKLKFGPLCIEATAWNECSQILSCFVVKEFHKLSEFFLRNFRNIFRFCNGNKKPQPKEFMISWSLLTWLEVSWFILIAHSFVCFIGAFVISSWQHFFGYTLKFHRVYEVILAMKPACVIIKIISILKR